MKFHLWLAVRALLVLAMLMLSSGVARAQQQPTSPATLPQRQANFAWDGPLLRASFSYKDVIDDNLRNSLSSGMKTTFAMRAYLFRDGDSTPVALAARSCVVAYDLWDEVYRVRIVERGQVSDRAALDLNGVVRLCAEPRDLIVANKGELQAGVAHFLTVIVDVNPISREMLEQMRRWVSRPTGSTSIGPGDALFGSFVSLFVRQIGTADKTLQFRTQAIVP